MRKEKLFAVAAAFVLAAGFPAGAVQAARGAVKAAGTAVRETAETDLSETEETSGGLSGEQVSELLDYVKQKWDAGELESREDIRAAIEEGEAEFDIALGDDVREKLTDALEQLDDLGLDHDAVIEKARELYGQYGDGLVKDAAKTLQEQVTGPVSEAVGTAVQEQLIEPAKEVAREAVRDTAQHFWRDLRDSVIHFFEDIFGEKE